MDHNLFFRELQLLSWAFAAKKSKVTLILVSLQLCSLTSYSAWCLQKLFIFSLLLIFPFFFFFCQDIFRQGSECFQPVVADFLFSSRKFFSWFSFLFHEKKSGILIISVLYLHSCFCMTIFLSLVVFICHLSLHLGQVFKFAFLADDFIFFVSILLFTVSYMEFSSDMLIWICLHFLFPHLFFFPPLHTVVLTSVCSLDSILCTVLYRQSLVDHWRKRVMVVVMVEMGAALPHFKNMPCWQE